LDTITPEQLYDDPSVASENTPGQNGSDQNHGVGQTAALIRGVTPDSRPAPHARIHHSLDWLTYTVPYEIGYEEAFPRHEALALTGEVLPNIKGYNTRLSLTHGSVSFHTDYPQQKICVQFTGQDLRLLRNAGVDLRNLLYYALGNGGWITRLDFVVDYYDPSSPRDLYQAWGDKTLRTPAHQCQFILAEDRREGEQEPAYTTYFGSNTSGRMLRCYDKAAQMKVCGPWTRIELVSRKERADRLGRAMCREDIGLVGKQAIRGFVQCKVAWFNDALTGPSVYIPAEPPKEHNTKRWLLDLVLPTLVKEVHKGAAEGDVEVRDKYLKALHETIGQDQCA
jgi:hypothetical protein